MQEELTSLLGKVKEVISENEGLQEKQKSGVLKSVFDYLHSDNEEGEEEDEDTEASEVLFENLTKMSIIEKLIVNFVRLSHVRKSGSDVTVSRAPISCSSLELVSWRHSSPRCALT